MLSHLSVTDGSEVLPSQLPLAPPTNLWFYETDWHKGEVLRKIFLYTCGWIIPKQSGTKCKEKKIAKRKKYSHNFHNEHRWKTEGRRKLYLFFRWKQGFFSSAIPLQSLPTQTWATGWEDLAQKTELLIYLVNGKCEFYEKFPSEALRARYSCNKWAPRSWKILQYSNL